MTTIHTDDIEQVGTVVHTFERAGLGKAPFRLAGATEKTYQACSGAPVQPGGSCAYCGQGIRYVFIIESADGKLFEVGSDCVAKTDDTGLRLLVDAKVRAIKREATHKRQDSLIAEALPLLAREDVRERLSSLPDPSGRNPNLLTQLDWYMHNAGRSGKSWAARKIIEAGNP